MTPVHRPAGRGVIGTAWGRHGEERLLASKPDWIARHPSGLLELLRAPRGQGTR